MSIPVHWEDGTWAVIQAKDHRAGLPRSKTNDTIADAAKSQSWDPACYQKPGPKSANHFIKVRLQDLKSFGGWHAAQGAPIQAVTPVTNGYMAPRVSAYDKPNRTIPDFPHRCHVCGGRTLELFSSIEHEGGKCPGPTKTSKRLYA